MAEKRTNISKLTMRYGVILHADKIGKINSIELPKLDERFLVLKAEDTSGENIIPLWASNYPILANETVDYVGQSILAIFGPDYESAYEALLGCNYSVLDESTEGQTLPGLGIEPLTLEWGSFKDTCQKPGLRQLQSEYVFDKRKSTKSIVLTATAWIDKGILNVEAPCQWPELILNTVATATGFSKDSIVVHPLEAYATLDEYFFASPALCALAANACIKLQVPIQLKDDIYSYSLSSVVDRSTWYTEEGKPVCESVRMIIDQGAYPVLSQEILRHAIAGLQPNYPLQAFEARVEVKNSSDYPSSLFGTLSFTDSLTATQLHFSKLARTLGKAPLDLMESFKCEARRFTDIIPSIKLDSIYNEAEKLAQSTTYRRRWFSYELQKGNTSVMPFTRGTAMTAAYGVSGFSTTFNKNNDYKIKLTLTEKGNLSISSSFYTKEELGEQWKQLIKEDLNLEDDFSILYNDRETPSIDSGPDTLSLSLGQVPRQLVDACQKLFASKEKRPIVSNVLTSDPYFPCEFEIQGSVALTLETRIDEISLLPIVSNVNALLKFGRIINADAVRTRLKAIISETLILNGAILSSNPRHPYSCNVELKSDGSDNIYTLDSTLRACTQSALLIALEQATGSELNHLPISDEIIFGGKK